jgi:hypothetical protein
MEEGDDDNHDDVDSKFRHCRLACLNSNPKNCDLVYVAQIMGDLG